MSAPAIALNTLGAPAGNPLFDLLSRCRDEPLVFDGIVPELCPALEQIILHRAQTSRSNRSLNVGGWKSGEDFFSWPDAAVQELRRFIVDEIGAPRPVGWAMINRAGSHHPRHQHRAAMLTGIYYVAPGDENAITPTIYECGPEPRVVRGRRPPVQELEVEPHPGRLVVCRGECWHSVPRYDAEAPRITIAFDVRR